MRALYIQIIISTVNESDGAWSYNPGNIIEKMRVTRRVLLEVPDVLTAIRDTSRGNFITASKFLHYGATNLHLWCPFEKPPFFDDQGSIPSGSDNVTSISRSKGSA